jgi:hypothetical protein
MASLRSGIRAVVNDADAAKSALWGMGLAAALGASKAQIAMAGLRDFVVGRLLGPLAGATAQVLGFGAGLLRLGRAFAEVGMRGAAHIEKLTMAFKVLLGGVEAARKRVDSLIKFSNSTPFELKGVVAANRTLQVLTKGALATEKGMKLVGDAAAAAGVDFESVAFQVGRLYDGLQNGTPVGEAAFRLQELGLLSGEARAQIEALQRSGADGASVWRVAEADLARYKGGMEAMSQTLENLQINLEDTKDVAASVFSKGYMNAEKAGIDAQTRAIKGLIPLFQYMGEVMGSVSNKWGHFKVGLMNATVGSKAFHSAAVPAFQAVSSVLGGLAFATGLVGLTRGVGIAIGAVRAARGAASMGAAKAASRMAAPPVGPVAGRIGGKIDGALTALFGAQIVMGTKAATVVSRWHQTLIGAAKAGGKFNVITYAMTAAVTLLGGALKMATGWIKGMARAWMDLGPIAWVLTLIGTVATGFYHYAKGLRASVDAMEAFQAAQAETVAALQREANAVRTAQDAHKVRARALREMVDLMEELKAVEDDYAKGPTGFFNGTMFQGRFNDEQQNKMDALKFGIQSRWRIARQMKDSGSFVFDDEQTASAAAVANAQRPALPTDVESLRAMLEERRAGGGGEQERLRIAALLDQNSADEAVARNEGRFMDAVGLQKQRGAIMEGSSDRRTQLQGRVLAVGSVLETQKKITDLNQQQAKMLGEGPSADKDQEAKRQRDLGKISRELQAQVQYAAALGPVTAEMAANYNAAAVELARMNEISAAAVAGALAERELEALEAALEVRKANAQLIDDELEKQRVLAGIEEERRDALVQRGQMSQAAADASAAADAATMQGAERDQGRRVEDVRLETETAILGLKDESLARELDMLDLEEQKLTLAIERSKITREEYALGLDAIDARRAAAERDAGRRRDAAVAEVQQTRLAVEARRAMASGQFSEADAARRKADAIGDAQSQQAEFLRLQAAGFSNEEASRMALENVTDRQKEREVARAEVVGRIGRELQRQAAGVRGNFGQLAASVRQERERELVEQGLSASQAARTDQVQRAAITSRANEDQRLASMRKAEALARQSGDKSGAKRWGRKADGIEERRRVEELIKSGVADDDAKRIAKRERRESAAEREASGKSLKIGGTPIVSSLVRLGGGTGMVGGGAVELMKEGNNLLRKIEANTRDGSKQNGKQLRTVRRL